MYINSKSLIEYSVPKEESEESFHKGCFESCKIRAEETKQGNHRYKIIY